MYFRFSGRFLVASWFLLAVFYWWFNDFAMNLDVFWLLSKPRFEG